MSEKKLDNLKKDTNKDVNSNIDMDAVQSIVSKMKNKSQIKGGKDGLSEGHLKELRSIISEGKVSSLDVNAEKKLSANTDSDLEKSVAKYYKFFKKLVDKIVLAIVKSKSAQKISYYLTSANSSKTLVQHLVISILFALFLDIFMSAIILVVLILINPLLAAVILPISLIFFLFLFTFILVYLVPKQKAKVRGKMIDVDLPFALRHIATEVSAGIGLYKVLQSVGKNDYGVLSEEINRTILEIENGTDTKTALRHTALRSQSKNFNVALFHIIRTLNTGGNLAHTINGVADTVSFDLMEDAKIFGEKMNFFGVIFIFIAIVLPVFAAILGGIANAPLGQDGALFLPGVMTPGTLTAIFVVILPIIFVFLMYYIKVISPKV